MKLFIFISLFFIIIKSEDVEFNPNFTAEDAKKLSMKGGNKLLIDELEKFKIDDARAKKIIIDEIIPKIKEAGDIAGDYYIKYCENKDLWDIISLILNKMKFHTEKVWNYSQNYPSHLMIRWGTDHQTFPIYID
jgi:hypothetical protein